MAKFEPAFQATMKLEGGFVLHEVKGDRGGMTYAGIARKFWPDWQGWKAIDVGETPDTQLVRDFYKQNFWDRIKGDEIACDVIAASLFDFAVNAGLGTAMRLAQMVIGATPDGVIGKKSLQALNEWDGEAFIQHYTIAKISRYATICNKNREQSKFLLGWINRSLRSVS